MGALHLMRLALFGGTFDPIHNAHLTVAREAADKFHFDQVWFVPAAHPPHKADVLGRKLERLAHRRFGFGQIYRIRRTKQRPKTSEIWDLGQLL